MLTIIILCTLYKKVLDYVMKQGIFSGTMRLIKHAHAHIDSIQELINTI